LDWRDKTENKDSYEFYDKNNSWKNETGFEGDLREEYNEYLERNAFPQEKPQNFSSGEVVRHPVFGIGRVLESYGCNEKAGVKVNFNIGGTRNLMLAYAKLEKVT